MVQQSLRQLARQLRSHNLAGFWQGSSVLAPHVQDPKQQVLTGQSLPDIDASHFGGVAFGADGYQDATQSRAFAALPAYEESADGCFPDEDLQRTSTTYSDLAQESSSESFDLAQPSSRSSSGTLQAQEHVTVLLDDGSFVPVTPFPEAADAYASSFPAEEALITGRGQIDGRPVCVMSQIPATADGCLSDLHSQQICHLMDHAMEAGIPIINLHDSSQQAQRLPPDSPSSLHSHASDGSPRMQASLPTRDSSHSFASSSREGGASMAGFTDVLQRHAEASGVVPQLGLSIGHCSMDVAMGFALSDFAFTVGSRPRSRAQSHAQRHQLVDADDQVEQELQAPVDWAAMLPNRQEALAHMRDLLSYLPLSNSAPPPKVLSIDPVDRFCPDLDCIVPDAHEKPYEVRDVIDTISDEGRWHEVAPHSSRNIVTGFGRMGGASVGIVANNPGVLRGCLDAGAAGKAARFVRFCDAFNVPLITLVDAPGFLVPPQEGRTAAVRAAAQLLYAYAEATVPKLTVILRMAHGSAYGIMGSKHLHSDVNLAWPSAKIAVRGPGGTRQLIFSAYDALFDETRIKAEAVISGSGAEAPRIARPLSASQYGIVDAVIRPAMTRKHLCTELALLQGKQAKRPRRKHGVAP